MLQSDKNRNSYDKEAISEELYSKTVSIHWSDKCIDLKIPAPENDGSYLKRQVILTDKNIKQWQVFFMNTQFSNLLRFYCSSKFIAKINILKAPKLATFSIYNTNIDSIPQQFCKQKYSQLQQVYIYQSKIKKIFKLNTPLLRKLVINKTQISQIFDLDDYPLLNIINLDDNKQLVHLLQLQMKCFLELQELYCCRCNLKIFPKFTALMLFKAIAYSNQLQNIQEFLKGDYPNLIEIDFQQNKIECIRGFEKETYSNLIKLCMSHNRLHKLNKINAINLQTLQLNYNSIKEIDKQFFNDKQKLKILYLSYSQIQTDTIKYLSSYSVASNKILMKLQQIDLQQNKITNIQFLSSMDLSSVEFISLKGNLISCFKVFQKLQIPMIKNLQLHFNLNRSFDNLCRTQIYQSLNKDQNIMQSFDLQINNNYKLLQSKKHTVHDLTFVFKLQTNPQSIQSIQYQNLIFNILKNSIIKINKKFNQAFQNKCNSI